MAHASNHATFSSNCTHINKYVQRWNNVIEKNEESKICTIHYRMTKCLYYYHYIASWDCELSVSNIYACSKNSKLHNFAFPVWFSSQMFPWFLKISRLSRSHFTDYGTIDWAGYASLIIVQLINVILHWSWYNWLSMSCFTGHGIISWGHTSLIIVYLIEVTLHWSWYN